MGLLWCLRAWQGPKCQSPSQQAENGLDIVRLTEPCSALDSCVQPLGDDPFGEAGDPQEAPPKPAARGHEGSYQGAMCPMPMTTAEENIAMSPLPPTLGLKAPREE